MNKNNTLLLIVAAFLLVLAPCCRKVIPQQLVDGVEENSTCEEFYLSDNQLTGDQSASVNFPDSGISSDVVSGKYVVTAVSGNKTLRITFTTPEIESPVYTIEYPDEQNTYSVVLEYINGSTSSVGFFGDIHVKKVNDHFEMEFCNLYLTEEAFGEVFKGRFIVSI